MDGSEGHEGGEGVREVLEILGKPPVTPKPGKGALDHPAVPQHDETLHIVAPLDDRHTEPWHLCHRGIYLPCVVAAIGPDQLEPRKTPAALVEHQASPVAILDGGRVDDNPHRQAFVVDQGVDLAALDLLPSVVTHLVVFAAPFSADFMDRLSRTAAEGLASRPIRSRKAMCNSAQIASQTPSRWNLRKML